MKRIMLVVVAAVLLAGCSARAAEIWNYGSGGRPGSPSPQLIQPYGYDGTQRYAPRSRF